MEAKTNPYDWILPVSNMELFAGRKEEIAAIEEQVVRLKSASPIAPMVAVVGERRVGKTSLLRKTAEICRNNNLLSVLISLEDRTASDAWEFWYESKKASRTN